MKIIYKILIAILLVLLGIEGKTNLFAQTFTMNKLNYSVKSDGSVKITGHSLHFTSGTINIDGYVTYNGKRYIVSEIGSEAFKDCYRATSIHIPGTVKTIGNYAFYQNNTDLTSVVISEGVRSIGNYAFAKCEQLTSISIPNSVTSFGESAFANCSKLKSINIPNGVTEIGMSTFSGCTNLTSITIPNSVTRIGYGAFYHCVGITSITIPSSVTSIGSDAFRLCENLTTVIIQNPSLQIDFEKVFNGCGKLQRSNVVYQSDKTTSNKTTPQNTASKPTSQNTNTKPASSQTTPQPETEFNGEVYQIVEQMPSFPGGDKARSEYISNNLKYPQTAIEKGVQGRVFVGFIVEPDGSISNVKVLRSLGSGCDEEAMRVIKSMPKWEPGKQSGQAVRVNYQIPVNFSLPK